MTTRSTFHLRTRLAVAPLIVVFSLSGCAVLQPRGEKVGLPTTAGYAKDQSIAVMLPTGNERFSKPAKAIEQGIKDARSRDEKVKLRPGARYEDSSNDPFEVYQSLVEDDPTIVIGPLLPSHVKQVIDKRDDETPLLALNSADAAAKGVYQFALKPEDEAETVAALIEELGLESPAVVYPSNDPWGSRMKDGFLAELPDAEAISYSSSSLSGSAKSRAAEAGAIFLVVRPEVAGKVYQALGGADAPAPIIASSHASDESGQYEDLEGLFYVDIPWLVDQDAIKASFAGDAEIDREFTKGTTGRLYAMGVDAYYLGARIINGESPAVTFEQGLTGELKFANTGRLLSRRLALGRFVGLEGSDAVIPKPSSVEALREAAAPVDEEDASDEAEGGDDEDAGEEE
jgi:outer membrane PBP1 activator LpoA protein